MSRKRSKVAREHAVSAMAQVVAHKEEEAEGEEEEEEEEEEGEGEI